MKMIKIIKMTIGRKLLAAFSFILLLLLLTTAIGIVRLAQSQGQIDKIIGVNNTKVKLALSMRDTVYERMIAIRTAALVGEVGKMQVEANHVKKEEDKYAKIESALAALNAKTKIDPGEKKLHDAIKKYSDTSIPLIRQSLEFSMAGLDSQAFTLLTEQLIPLQAHWMQSLDDLAQLEDRLSTQAGIDSQTTYQETLVLMLSLGAFAFLGGMAVAITLTRHITRQLGGEPAYAVLVAERIAAGDLATGIELRKADRSSLLSAIKGMCGDLAEMIGVVRKDCDHIALASVEIANGNIDLSARTEEQAAALKEAAASMDDITVTVQKNADSAQQANVLAAATAELAEQGGRVVSRVVNTMRSIDTSAKKIVDIIAVIDGLAFQTNILALNAAVEAARAGEQGRGFAVVAMEVQNLAKRSAAAAKEIKLLISDSAQQVTQGNQLVDTAGQTMEQIVESVKRVVEIIAEISIESGHQSKKLLLTSESVARLDRTTQENAALVELVATAAAHLQERTEKMAHVMSAFKLSSTQTQLLIDH